MKKKDYQKELDLLIEELIAKKQKAKLFLHSCCAPCSSHCLTYLDKAFDISVFFYNPNITDLNEYNKRLLEQERLLRELPLENRVLLEKGAYEPELFFENSKGLEKMTEGSLRCLKCYELRLKKTAQVAKENKAEFFGTTLSVSPYKNSEKLYEIGIKIEQEIGIKFLVSDFKKRGGYQHSIELSRKYELYRQPYCGCVFSFEEFKRRKENLI